MTLEQLEDKLPNGLHDAEICSITRDFEKETVTMVVNVLVGLPGDSAEKRDDTRAASITFTDVRLFTIAPPTVLSACGVSGSISFHAERSKTGLLPAEIESDLQQCNDLYSLYVYDWESYIHIATSGIRFEWNQTSEAR